MGYGWQVAMEPKHAEAWAELGFAHLERNEYDLAGKALERSLALDPERVQPY